MKNGTPRQSSDLRAAPDHPLDHEQELLSRRIKVLERRLLMLNGDERSIRSSQDRERSATPKPSRQPAELGLKAKEK
jgi:hypothetical protein